MKIIDFEKKGNLVRFYLGKNSLDDYYGDDWDDFPYEHNAGTVYERYISGYTDIVFPFDWEVLEPKDDWHYEGNSPYCKNDFKDRKSPCILAVPPEEAKNYWDCYYSELLGDENCYRFYFGDEMESINNLVKFTENNNYIKISSFGKLN